MSEELSGRYEKSEKTAGKGDHVSSRVVEEVSVVPKTNILLCK